MTRLGTCMAVMALLTACGDDESSTGGGGSSSAGGTSTTADGGGGPTTGNTGAAGSTGAVGSTGGAGGTGGDGQGGDGGGGGEGQGGDAGPIGEACEAYDSARQTVADELGCESSGTVESCPTFLESCETEVVALYACRTENTTAESCSCQDDHGVSTLDCPDLDDACSTENDDLLECDDV